MSIETQNNNPCKEDELKISPDIKSLPYSHFLKLLTKIPMTELISLIKKNILTLEEVVSVRGEILTNPNFKHFLSDFKLLKLASDSYPSILDELLPEHTNNLTKDQLDFLINKSLKYHGLYVIPDHLQTKDLVISEMKKNINNFSYANPTLKIDYDIQKLFISLSIEDNRYTHLIRETNFINPDIQRELLSSKNINDNIYLIRNPCSELVDYFINRNKYYFLLSALVDRRNSYSKEDFRKIIKSLMIKYPKYKYKYNTNVLKFLAMFADSNRFDSDILTVLATEITQEFVNEHYVLYSIDFYNKIISNPNVDQASLIAHTIKTA